MIRLKCLRKHLTILHNQIGLYFLKTLRPKWILLHNLINQRLQLPLVNLLFRLGLCFTLFRFY
jgi:hypothetical protein